MSEIPYVGALGDAIDTAVARPRRFWRPPMIAAVAAVFLLGSGAAAVALFSSPTELAAGEVGCYDAAGDVSVLQVQGSSPVATCARVLHTTAPLVACARGDAVAVYMRRAPAGCRPLPPGYAAARLRVIALQRRLAALDARADCNPPGGLARQADAVLRGAGWTDWHASVLGHGPCGTVSAADGGGRRSVPLDPVTRTVTVFTGPPQSVAARVGRLAVALERLSGRRCFNAAGLRGMTQRAVGGAIGFRYTRPQAGVEYTDARQRRLEQGCAIVADVRTGPGYRGTVVEIQSMARR